MLKSRPTQSAKPLTEEETILWAELRMFRKLGYAIRRQVKIGPFTVDFLCRKAKLIIEIDGDHHGTDDTQWGHDRERSQWLRLQGYEVIRFWNGEIREDVSAVVEAIFEKIKMRADSRRSEMIT